MKDGLFDADEASEHALILCKSFSSFGNSKQEYRFFCKSVTTIFMSLIVWSLLFTNRSFVTCVKRATVHPISGVPPVSHASSALNDLSYE